MKIALGKFARFGLETRFRNDVGVGVQAALLHYARRLRSGRPPVDIPALFRSQAPAPHDAGGTFYLPVDPEIEVALERKALEHRVPVGQVLDHAVFVYLADLDAAAEPDLMVDALRPLWGSACTASS
ncbi:MAG: hypothetical protein WBM00_01460 [Solirubrobacterales bacterium]